MDGATGINMERIIALASAAPGQVHERTDDSAPNSGGRGGGGRPSSLVVSLWKE